VSGAEDIGVALGKVINKYKMGKHVDYQITDTSLTVERSTTRSRPKPRWRGIYVLRTSRYQPTTSTRPG
jgi:hypothetical protein